jgi:hypothetical protein
VAIRVSIRSVALVVAAVGVGALAVPMTPAVAKTIQDVFVTNTPANPVPTQAQGTTAVAGTVNVATDPAAREPYQEANFFNQGTETCSEFSCTVSFPPVPAGKRLVITYASAQHHLSSGGTRPSVLLGLNGDPSGEVVLLPAPQATGSDGADTYITAGPVTFYAEAGDVPTMFLLGQPVHRAFPLLARAGIAGHLVPAS